MSGFLPITKSEIPFDGVDFVVVSGDAYVDHPSFGHAVIARLMEALGFSVAIMCNPLTEKDYLEFGVPKKGFLVTSGVVDSMVNNYSAAKQKRKTDVYSVGGVNRRPDRALNFYCQNIRKHFGNEVAVMIGGIEASLRRFAHYDYWTDKVLPSVLLSSGADLLVYGMGEKVLMDIAKLLNKGIPLKNIKDVRGTVYAADNDKLSAKLSVQLEDGDAITVPSFEKIFEDKNQYVQAFNLQSQNTNHINAKVLVQHHGNKLVVQNIPQLPLTQAEMDFAYNLPYMRDYHPSYKSKGGVKAIEEVKFSITSHRGCFGGCNFCALNYHQGRVIQNRSHDSIVREAAKLTDLPDFKGYIHDVGGPTANFRNVACTQQQEHGVCKNKQCIGNAPCKNLVVDHKDYLDLLRKLRNLPRVKKVFVRSGVRFDYLMMDSDRTFFRELLEHHVSGQLKIAPEHTSNTVLERMNKPKHSVYEAFSKEFYSFTSKLKKEQYLVPYLISGHPSSTLNDAVSLACYLKERGHSPQQVQDFYPTPSTKSTTMFYTGIDPDTLFPVYVPKTYEEKAEQRALLQFNRPENYQKVVAALMKAKRTDLIGLGKYCLVKPIAFKRKAETKTGSRTDGRQSKK